MTGPQKKYAEFIDGKKTIAVSHGFWLITGKKHSQLKGDAAKKEAEVAANRDAFIKQVRDLVGQGKVVAILDSGDPMEYGPWNWTLEEFEGPQSLRCARHELLQCGECCPEKEVPQTQKYTKSVILSANDCPQKRHHR